MIRADFIGTVEINGVDHQATLTYDSEELGWEISIVGNQPKIAFDGGPDEQNHYYSNDLSADEVFRYAVEYTKAGEGL